LFIALPRSFRKVKSKQKSRGSIPLLPPVYLQTWSFCVTQQALG
jgi:hypothetical protein